MERAASSVGLDFLGHPFWDKYLEFAETRLANPKRVLELLDRIVVIPMHQYARYYEKWRGLRSSMKPTEALDNMTLEVFTNEIHNSPETKDFETALKEKIDAQTAAVYKRTQEGTNKRWVYEAEIKRSYFHVKPLDRPQLENWSKYLDFEESQNDIGRIRALYERCLVPCVSFDPIHSRKS
jgi:pre-mRNA-processing factor 39